MKAFLIVTIVLASVFFVIGLPLYLCGCHDVIQPNCLRFFVQNTKVIDHRVELRTCSECISWTQSCSDICNGGSCTTSCSSNCAAYNYYDCYNSYAITSVNLVNQTSCELTVTMGSTNKNGALEAAKNRYPLGSEFEIYVDKNSRQCLITSDVESIAIAGLVFLLLTGSVLITMGILALWTFCGKR